MPIRKVLLPLTSTRAGVSALTAAWTISREFGAHMTAVHVRTDSRDVAPLAGEGLSGAMIQDMMAATETESTRRADAVRAMFDQFVTEQAVPLGPESMQTRGAHAGFLGVVGREEDLVAQLARLADLTVVPHPEADEDLSSSDALHAVLFDSGKPVMVAPVEPPGSIGRRVAVAWNGSAESAAALSAGLPWLRKADAVRILVSDEYQRRGPLAPAVVEYLGFHGIRPEVGTFRSVDREVGAGLLAAAREFRADLMTMGAYSHSRIRQLILGGVTRHVLEHATLPVLMNR
jgi:nucleotide-binding universal stress UspA family protein